MKLNVHAVTLSKKISLITTAFVLAVSTLTAAVPFVLAKNASAVAGDTVNGISTFEGLKDALGNTSVGYINLAPKAAITATEKLVLSRSDVRINGNDSTITLDTATSASSEWKGDYVFQAYNVTNVEINSLRVQGGDAGFLINGSEVTLKGNTHPLNNQFGGIEVSRGANVSRDSKLTLQGNLWDESYKEANTKPAVWVVNGQGTIDQTNLNSKLTAATHIKADQTQYYLRAANTGTVATNTSTKQTYATLQAAFDAAGVGDTVQLNQNVVIPSGGVAALIKKSIIFDGNNLSISTVGTRGSGGDQKNAALIVEGSASGATVKNLTVTGTAPTNIRESSHGIVVFSATNVTLQNITATNNAAGVVVNGSTVLIDGIRTSGNSWYGINVDKANAKLTIQGANSHTEAAPIYVDNRGLVTVTDVNKNYAKQTPGGTVDVYLHDTDRPVIASVTPVTGTALKSGNIVVQASDDVALRKVSFVIEGTGKYGVTNVTSGTSGTVTRSIADFNLPDGTYSIKATAEDVAGKYAVPKTVVVTIDNQKPTASNISVNPNPAKAIDGSVLLTFTAKDQLSNIASAKYTLYDDATDAVIAKNVPINGAFNAKEETLSAPISIVGLPVGTYRVQLHFNDAAGNQGKATTSFSINNVDLSTQVTINPIVSAGTNTPIISGRVVYTADASKPAANQPVLVEVDSVDYQTTTNANGEWSITTDPLDNSSYVAYVFVGGVSSPTGQATSDAFTVNVVSEEEPGTANPGTGTPNPGTGTGTPEVDPNAAPAPEAEEPQLPSANGNPAFGLAAILGTNTTGNSSDAASNSGTAGTPEVEGASTEDTLAAATNNTDGNAFGLAWYWWLLILAGGAGGLWWLISAIRGRATE